MKIAMISKALVVGAYHKKLEELAHMGIDLSLIVPPAWDGLPLEIHEAQAYRIFPTRIFCSGKNHFHVYAHLKRVLQAIRPDIVHIDEEHYSLVTYQAMRAAVAIGSRTLFFTWQNIFKKYPFPFSSIEKYNFSHADSAIAGNHEAADVLKRKGFTKEIYEIPQFGVDPELFRKTDAEELRKKLGFAESDIVIGFMGRFVEEKGLGTLLEILPQLNTSARLLLIGSGPHKEALMKKAVQLGMGHKVSMVAQVPSLEVPRYLNCMNCLVLPSLTRANWKEQFGRVLIESMACEVPVIGSSSGEIPHVIGDGGLVFQEGQGNDLLAKLGSLVENASLRNELGQKGRQRVLEHYTQKKIAEATHAVYQNILKLPRASCL